MYAQMKMWNISRGKTNLKGKNEFKKSSSIPTHKCKREQTLTITWFMDDNIVYIFHGHIEHVSDHYCKLVVCMCVIRHRMIHVWCLAAHAAVKPEGYPQRNAYKWEFAKVCWHDQWMYTLQTMVSGKKYNSKMFHRNWSEHINAI